MLQFYKRFSKTGIDLALLALTVIGTMFLFSFAYQVAAPIFIAVLIYLLVQPVSSFLSKKGMKKKTATNIAMLSFVLLLLSALTLFGAVLTSQINSLSMSLPTYISFFKNLLIENGDFLKNQIDAIPPDVMTKAQETLSTLAGKLSSLLSSSLTGIFTALSSISSIIFNLLVGIILAYFLCLEVEDWKKYSAGKLPKTLIKATSFLKVHVLSGIGKYIKAQLKLISYTFIIIFVALVFAGVENSLSIALFSALFDMLPLLGIPVIFIPWIIYSFIVGKTGFALFLLGLLAFTMVFRQIMEPKVAGDSLGVSAFTMLSAMIISLSVFGVGGLIITPVLIILIKSLIEEGYLKQWIRVPEDEFETDNATSTPFKE